MQTERARSTCGLVLSALLAACPGQVPPGGSLTPRDAGVDLTSPDTGSDAPNTPDQAERHDSGEDRGVDLPPPADQRPADSAPPCAMVADANTVALYRFESVSSTSTIANEVGPGHEASIRVNQLTLVPGPPGCGLAASFGGSTFLEIPHDPAFQLSKGSVELWVRFAQDGAAGLLSKDAKGQRDSGHLTLYRSCDGAVVLRQQTKTETIRHCSTPLSNGVWHHVAANFGPAGLELYVDGQLQNQAGAPSCAAKETCGGTLAAGIDANKNPWVVGASAAGSDNDKATPVREELVGAMDNLRISRVRRTFP